MIYIKGKIYFIIPLLTNETRYKDNNHFINALLPKYFIILFSFSIFYISSISNQ